MKVFYLQEQVYTSFHGIFHFEEGLNFGRAFDLLKISSTTVLRGAGSRKILLSTGVYGVS